MPSLAQHRPVQTPPAPEITGELESGLEITRAGLEGQGIVPVNEISLTDSGLAVYRVDRAKTDGTLEDVIENGSVSPTEAVSLTLGALKVVNELKAQGLVAHGDISPKNVLFDRAHETGAISGFHNTRFGNEALAMIGVEPVLIGDEELRHPLHLDPSFTAPEVVGGGLPDSSSDVYEAGRTLLYALHGRRLKPTVEYEEFMDTYEPVAPPDLSTDFPAFTPNSMRFAIQHALDPNPAERPDMGQLIGETGAGLDLIQPAS